MAAAGPAGPGSGRVTHVDVWLSLPALMPQLIGGKKRRCCEEVCLLVPSVGAEESQRFVKPSPGYPMEMEHQSIAGKGAGGGRFVSAVFRAAQFIGGR